MFGENHAIRSWFLGLILLFTSFAASADVYTDCQALLVDGTLAEQQSTVLHEVLKKFAYKDAEPAYFKIGKFRLAVIPSDRYSSDADLIPIDTELQNISEEWSTRMGNVSIFETIHLNNLPYWTGRFLASEALGIFFLAPFTHGDTATAVYISTVIATFSYVFASAFDGPDVASEICQFFGQLKPIPHSFSENALFVIKAPKNVINALRAFSHFKRNDVTYYPRPWIERKAYQKMQKEKAIEEKAQALIDQAKTDQTK